LSPAMNLRSVLTVALTLAAPALHAQGADEGTLLIRRGGRDIGSENYRVTGGDAGLRITATASYAGSRPPTELSGSVERTAQGSELAFQLEHRGTAGSQVYAVQKRNRLTIRRVERGGEQASEAPGSSSTVLLADSVFALYLQLVPLASDAGRPVTAVFPLTGRRISFTAQRLPTAPAGGALIRLAGGLEGELVLGNRGELLRISLPALGLEAVRKRE